MFIFLLIFLSKAITYSYRVIIARFYGPEVYGLFSLGLIIFLWFVVFSSLGLLEGILRFVSFYRGRKDMDKVRFVIRYSFVILIFSSIVSGILLYFLSGLISNYIFHNSGLIVFLKIFSFMIPAYMMLYALLSVMQAFEKIKTHSFISDFLQNLIKLSSFIILIFIGVNINSVVFSYFIGVLGALIIAFLYSKYKLPEIFQSFKIKKKDKIILRKELFSYSWPLIVLGLISNIMPYIDSFVIGFFKDASAVGIYNAAVPIAELILLFPNLFMRLFFPLVTREFSKKNLSIVRELSKQIVKWILIINLPLFVLIIIFPGAFINILFGAEYLGAENSLRFLSIGFLFTSISVVFYSLISMIGKSKIILINTIIISVIDLILNIILVPKYGITGAAFSTMLGQIALTLIFFIQVKYYTSIVPLKRKMLRIFISIIPPALTLYYINRFIPETGSKTLQILYLFLQVLFFGLLYLLIIFLTKSLDKNDIMILNSVKKKIKKEEVVVIKEVKREL